MQMGWKLFNVLSYKWVLLSKSRFRSNHGHTEVPTLLEMRPTLSGNTGHRRGGDSPDFRMLLGLSQLAALSSVFFPGCVMVYWSFLMKLFHVHIEILQHTLHSTKLSYLLFNTPGTTPWGATGNDYPMANI